MGVAKICMVASTIKVVVISSLGIADAQSHAASILETVGMAYTETKVAISLAKTGRTRTTTAVVISTAIDSGITKTSLRVGAWFGTPTTASISLGTTTVRLTTMETRRG